MLDQHGVTTAGCEPGENDGFVFDLDWTVFRA